LVIAASSRGSFVDASITFPLTEYWEWAAGDRRKAQENKKRYLSIALIGW